MKTRFRIIGTVAAALTVVFALVALTSSSTPKTPAQAAAATVGARGGELSVDLLAKETVLSGAYKAYGLEDTPVGLWMAKAVFRNDTDGTVRGLKVRYRFGQYTEWSAWSEYPALVPTQTAVDLYHPILSRKCAKLTGRTPVEMRVEAEYTDAAGRRRTFQRNCRMNMLGRHEFIFTDLQLNEQTGSYQDLDTNSYLMAAWVTPQDIAVSGLASLANERAKGAGAAIDNESCWRVMKELYEIMRTIRITYQTPGTVIQQEKSFDMKLVQALQYPRDTIRKRSGTCIDLAMLYAAMMQSVGIRPMLVSMDGHCFPIGVMPGGKFVPVEATCVGGGGRNSQSFEVAVKDASKTWAKLQQNGRFNLVDCRKMWAAGISPAELDPLPADILDRWKVNEEVRKAWAAQRRTGPGTGTGIVNPPPPARIKPGQWACTITQADGRKFRCAAQVTVQQGNRVQVVFVIAYSLLGPDGLNHMAREVNTFVGQVQGNRVVAQCNQATWTLDGNNVNPQGMPMALQLTLGQGGAAAGGSVRTSAGLTVQVAMQAR